MSLHGERMERFEAAGLYLVTGEAFSGGRRTLDIVQQALDAGVRLIQLREKDKTKRERFRLACGVRELCRQYQAILIIDDDVDIALAADADGVHLGNEDLDPAAARRIFPQGIIGVSTHSPEEASAVDTTVASYFNIGPIFQTSTKSWDGAFLGPQAIAQIAPCCALPFTVMGGIKRGNIQQVLDAGAKTVAVVTAVTGAQNPAAECRCLLDMIAGHRRGG